MNPEVDFYFSKGKQWQPELEAMRTIILDCGLTEDLKWGVPCYSYQKKNIVLLHTFKDYCAMLFFKGALLKDPKMILIQQTENVQSARQARFTHLRDVVKLEPVLKAYIYEAIEVEKAGLKVPLKKTTEYSVPEEFQQQLNKTARLKKAFHNLTPGRQRAYLLYFAAAKQSKTRIARIEKSIPQIMEGRGLND